MAAGACYLMLIFRHICVVVIYWEFQPDSQHHNLKLQTFRHSMINSDEIETISKRFDTIVFCRPVIKMFGPSVWIFFLIKSLICFELINSRIHHF